MNKKMLAVLAVALVVALGAVGLITTQMGENKSADASNTTAAATPADSSESQAAQVEPAAEEKPATASASADNPVVAKVDGGTVTRSEVLNFIQNLPPQMKQLPIETLFPMALEQVINGKIVGEKASKTDVASAPEVKARLKDAEEQIIRAVYVEKEIEKSLSSDRVQKAYDKFAAEQGKTEEVHARHILVEKEDQAKDIIKKIEGGAKFEELAKEHSKDTGNKTTGGDLGYFTKGDMVKEFSDAAFEMKKGDVSKTPVKTQFGYHIIKIEDRRTRPVPELASIKPQLEAQERRQILEELLKEWRAKATVETFDINGEPIKSEAKKETPKAE